MGFHSEAAFQQFERDYAEAEERKDIARERYNIWRSLMRGTVDHRAETEARTAEFWRAEEEKRLAPIKAQYDAAMAGWARLPKPKVVLAPKPVSKAIEYAEAVREGRAGIRTIGLGDLSQIGFIPN